MKVPVLLPKIFDYPLTYQWDSKKNFETGDIVEVPFGKDKEIGVVWNSIQETNKIIKLRNIRKKIKKIKINKDLVKFINWFSVYNIVPRGMVLRMCFGGKNNTLKNEDKNDFEINIRNIKYFLNDEQKVALKDLEKFKDKFNVSVLQGVTGSGKTIVYFERIKNLLKKKKQVLVLLPEIFLTNEFENRFLDFFGSRPAVWHSKITPKTKRKIWQGVIKNEIKLVIGARSSLFLPFKDLGLIVVDEEHDPSYKQEEGLIYNARDMAIARASIEDFPIILVSSIPSLETFNHIKNKKYRHTKILKRFNDYPLPDTKIVNLNLNKIKNNLISDETDKIVKKYLDKNEQILFFLNRRGYSPFLICKICGYKHSCPNCSIYLTYHKSVDRLVCHHCGHKKNIIKKCVDGKNNCNFIMYGTGVEKIFDELKIKYPEKNIKIFSSDYLAKKKETKEVFEGIKNNKIDILVGTQMISKGFNFPKLNCIVVVDADFSGRGYDLRTTEKNIQLYNQLSGRAGRFSSNSVIVYQTITPLHETLKDLLQNNPEKFLENELIVRKQNNLPPFKRLIAIIISSNSKHYSLLGAKEIKKKIQTIKDIEVLGPVDSPIFRIKKMYRTRLLVRSKNEIFMQKKLVKVLDKIKISTKIKLTVDVDPINFN
tara:strand:- start:1587 stop:3542 length:1956 start_codon:yes stop_codon:yes gene_type:complete